MTVATLDAPFVKAHIFVDEFYLRKVDFDEALTCIASEELHVLVQVDKLMRKDDIYQPPKPSAWGGKAEVIKASPTTVPENPSVPPTDGVIASPSASAKEPEGELSFPEPASPDTSFPPEEEDDDDGEAWSLRTEVNS